MRVVGVDACRGGWVAVTLDDSAFVTTTMASRLSTLFAAALPDGIGAAGVDMPLGLLEAGWRDCDTLARGLLGPRRGSVFAIPPRAVWECQDYPAAVRLCRELTGGGFSVQAWGLRAKLLEANSYRHDGLYEVHPELAFAAMNDGGPLADSKHTRAGQAARRALLRMAVGLPPDVAPPRGCPVIDLLDAAAVAWSTLRIASGTGVVLPDPPQRDPHGHEVAIRY